MSRPRVTLGILPDVVYIQTKPWPRIGRNGIKLVSITQEIGDDPMHVLMRQMMALFDEYQSKENGKHTLRAMKENARQGCWNGSRPPIGYRVVAAGQRGAKVKKKLEMTRCALTQCG